MTTGDIVRRDTASLENRRTELLFYVGQGFSHLAKLNSLTFDRRIVRDATASTTARASIVSSARVLRFVVRRKRGRETRQLDKSRRDQMFLIVQRKRELLLQYFLSLTTIDPFGVGALVKIYWLLLYRERKKKENKRKKRVVSVKIRLARLRHVCTRPERT